MGKKAPSQQSVPPADTRLGDLLASRGFAQSAAPSPTAPPATGEFDLADQGKLVLRRERKGRGGKTVTLLTGLSLPPARLEALARALRKALGCGSVVEGDIIVLQGDIVPRAQEWLVKHGAKKIVLGN
jgi:translation initiation factor 1